MYQSSLFTYIKEYENQTIGEFEAYNLVIECPGIDDLENIVYQEIIDGINLESQNKLVIYGEDNSVLEVMEVPFNRVILYENGSSGVHRVIDLPEIEDEEFIRSIRTLKGDIDNINEAVQIVKNLPTISFKDII